MLLINKLLYITFSQVFIWKSGAVYNFLVEFSPKELSNFNELGTQNVFHWKNNKQNSKFFVKLTVSLNRTETEKSLSCPDYQLHVLVRNDAIPVPNPYSTIEPSSVVQPLKDWGVVYKNNFTISLINNSVYSHYNFSFFSHQSSSDLFMSIFLKGTKNLNNDELGFREYCKYFIYVTVYQETILEKVLAFNYTEPKNVTNLKRQKRDLFDVMYISEKSLFNLTFNHDVYFKWEVYSLTDSGGTMVINLNQASNDSIISYNNTRVCISRYYLTENSRYCENKFQLNRNSEKLNSTWYIPYPQAGSWYINIMLLKDVGVKTSLQLEVKIISCIESCHENNAQGRCLLYRNDELLLASCKCQAGWQGIACTDNTTALSFSQQIIRTLVLTMSNLMFLPCTVLAANRKYYSAALVYFYVCFMSLFYHACDQPGNVVYCLLPYETLQFSDFFGSVCATWFTLVLMARSVWPLFEHWLHVFGCLFVATLVSYNRFSLWSFVAPITIGCIYFVSSWTHKCRTDSVCFPSRNILYYSILPGGVFAVVGFCLYAFAETPDNYYITHSTWHVCMAIAVMFLLPRKVQQKRLILPSYNVETNYAAVDENNHAINDQLPSITSTTY